MRSTPLVLSALLLSLLAGASAASAQQVPSSSPPASAPASNTAQEPSDLTTLKLSTRLRILEHARGRQIHSFQFPNRRRQQEGNPVTTNLTKDDFTILDDKHKKEIYSFDGPNGVPRRTSTLRFVVRDMLSGKMGTAELPRTVADATPLATSPMPEAKPRLGSSDAPAAAKPNPGN